MTTFEKFGSYHRGSVGVKAHLGGVGKDTMAEMTSRYPKLRVAIRTSTRAPRSTLSPRLKAALFG